MRLFYEIFESDQTLLHPAVGKPDLEAEYLRQQMKVLLSVLLPRADYQCKPLEHVLTELLVVTVSVRGVAFFKNTCVYVI